MELEYIKTDRNGTKYYHDWTCPRCGGAGESDKWYYTGKTCYACGGTGKRANPRVVKEYTEEYAAKLVAKRKAREDAKPKPDYEELKARARAAERRNFLDNGLTEEGIGYVYKGNTYPIKDRIKAVGGKWEYGCWVAPILIDIPNDVSAREVNINEYRTECGFDWFLAFQG